jgi:hypothetical protein
LKCGWTIEKRVRKSKQCGQKQRKERERAGNGISYIKMRSTVLSVATSRHCTADSTNHTKQTAGIKQSRHPRARPNLCLKISVVCIKNSAVINKSANHYSLPITTVCGGGGFKCSEEKLAGEKMAGLVG